MSEEQGRAAVPRLVVRGGPMDGAALQVDAERSLGSSAECDLRFDADHIESVHARVRWDGRELVLADPGSVSGVYVNDTKVRGLRALQGGDRISLGPPTFRNSVQLVVEVPDPEPVATDAAAAAAEAVPPVAPDPSPPTEAAALPVEAAAPAPSDAELPVATAPEPTAPEPTAPAPLPTADAPPPVEPASDDFVLAAPARRGAPDEPGPPPPAFDLAPPQPELSLAFDDSPPSPEEAREAAPAPSAPAPVAPSAAGIPPAAAPPRAPTSPATAQSQAARLRDLIGDELPSIAGAAREGVTVPAPERSMARAPRPVPRKPSRTRLLAVAAGTALLAAGGFHVYRTVLRPPPVIATITPPKAQPGQTVTIRGTSFSEAPAELVVKVGDSVASVTAASEDELAITVPALAIRSTTDLPVVVEKKGERSNAVFMKVYRAPKVTRVEPEVALPGAEVVLHGEHLDGADLAVTVGDERAEARDVTARSLRVTVPALRVDEGTATLVAVEVGGEAARPVELLVGRLPLVARLDPPTGAVGDRVTLVGRGFDADVRRNRVTFAGRPALLVSATPTSLAVVVPGGAAASEAQPVRVETAGQASGPAPAFNVVVPSAAVYVPRFTAVPVPEHEGHDHVLVRCELGPVMLLSGRGAAASTAERGATVAQALNAAFAGGGSLAFEPRGEAVGVAGGAEVVRATPEDAAGYGEGFEGVKASPPTPDSLAALWTALLQDFATLFVRHQRPVRLAEVSPHGTVLLDLYAQAARRGGGDGGVPASLVSPPSAALTAGLRRAAFTPPSSPAGTGLTALGPWSGETDEGGQKKSVVLELRQEGGGRFSGTLTTRAGGVSVAQPLQDVRMEKGALRFALVSSGVRREFSGRIDGASLSGTISGGARGTFSLRHVD